MSRGKRRAAGIAAAAAGTVVAAAVGGVLAQRHSVRERRVTSTSPDRFGSLRSDPLAVTTDDAVTLHAEIDEPDEPVPGQPTLVFVHGYALNLDCWHFQRERFRGERRMVFYDQRSHGRSGRSPAGHATIDQLGQDLQAVLDQLAPEEPVILIGHSMGGMTVMALAEQRPEWFGDRVVGVGLVSTTAGGLKPHRLLGPFLPDRLMRQVTPRAMAALARAPGLVDGARRTGSDIGFLATSKFAFGGEVPTPYVEFVDEMLAHTPFEVLAEFFPNFDTLDKYSVLKAFESVPTVIICGTNDLMTSIEHSRRLAARIRGAQLVECLDAGHMVILERKEQVNVALERMTKEADAGARP